MTAIRRRPSTRLPRSCVRLFFSGVEIGRFRSASCCPRRRSVRRTCDRSRRAWSRRRCPSACPLLRGWTKRGVRAVARSSWLRCCCSTLARGDFAVESALLPCSAPRVPRRTSPRLNRIWPPEATSATHRSAFGAAGIQSPSLRRGRDAARTRWNGGVSYRQGRSTALARGAFALKLHRANQAIVGRLSSGHPPSTSRRKFIRLDPARSARRSATGYRAVLVGSEEVLFGSGLCAGSR